MGVQHHSDETRRVLSEKMKQLWATKSLEDRKNRGIQLKLGRDSTSKTWQHGKVCQPGCTCKRHKQSEDHRQANRDGQYRRWKMATPEERAEFARRNSAGKRSPEYHEQRSRLARESALRPENMRKRLEGLIGTGRGKKRTRLELKVAETLRELNIEFEEQSIIGDYAVDFLIRGNIVLEADGDYWHNLPQTVISDKRKSTYLRHRGYTVCRVWEHDVYNDPMGSIKAALSLNRSGETATDPESTI